MYTQIIAFEWALLGFSLWHSDIAFSGNVRRVLKSPRALLIDIPVAAALAAVLLLISPVIEYLLGKGGWDTTQGMMPQTHAEVALWIVMAVTAGICEEAVFRGYLQLQIAGWTGSAAVGVVGQGLIFGLCHAYQGWKKVTLICVWGCVFGLFVWWRKGLRANMIGHAALDIGAIFG